MFLFLNFLFNKNKVIKFFQKFRYLLINKYHHYKNSKMKNKKNEYKVFYIYKTYERINNYKVLIFMKSFNHFK